MVSLRYLLSSAALCLALSSTAHASNVVLFDVEERKEQLQSNQYAQIHEYCMATNLDQPEDKMPEPVAGLKKTEGYGSDRSLSNFAWYLMVYGGRALAGDDASAMRVKTGLLTWSKAGALFDTEEIHDAYYALKRGLLPIITNYLIVKDDLSRDEQRQIENWIDPLVRKVDKMFDGDVDHNNHRYLADSVLTLWGDVIDDKTLYAKGKQRFLIALDQMQADGALPLETRRGTRALWYIRQAITNLGMIAEIYHQNGDEDLYNLVKDGKSLSLLTNYFVSGIHNPLLMHDKTVENYIPGPSDAFLEHDLEFLHTRGGRRHYMSFAHLYLQRYPDADMAKQRMARLVQDTAFQELPMIDDFAGGNATCFWGQP